MKTQIIEVVEKIKGIKPETLVKAGVVVAGVVVGVVVGTYLSNDGEDFDEFEDYMSQEPQLEDEEVE